MEFTVCELLCLCNEKCLELEGFEDIIDGVADVCPKDVVPTRALSRIDAGGIAIVLEFVSTVLVDITVGLVDCIECISEKVEDLTDEEQKENKGAILA